MTKITNHPSNKVKSDPQKAVEQPRQVSPHTHLDTCGMPLGQVGSESLRQNKSEESSCTSDLPYKNSLGC